MKTSRTVGHVTVVLAERERGFVGPGCLAREGSGAARGIPEAGWWPPRGRRGAPAGRSHLARRGRRSGHVLGTRSGGAAIGGLPRGQAGAVRPRWTRRKTPRRQPGDFQQGPAGSRAPTKQPATASGAAGGTAGRTARRAAGRAMMMAAAARDQHAGGQEQGKTDGPEHERSPLYPMRGDGSAVRPREREAGMLGRRWEYARQPRGIKSTSAMRYEPMSRFPPSVPAMPHVPANRRARIATRRARFAKR